MVSRMKDQVITLLEALRRSQTELDAYMEVGERGAKADPEITIAKLVAILGDPEVVRASMLLSGVADSPSIVPSDGKETEDVS
jgi:hypothetical protein